MKPILPITTGTIAPEPTPAVQQQLPQGERAPDELSAEFEQLEEISSRASAHEYIGVEVAVIELGLRIVDHIPRGDNKRRDTMLDAIITSWLSLAGRD